MTSGGNSRRIKLLHEDNKYYYLKAKQLIFLRSLSYRGNMGRPVLAGISNLVGMSCLNFFVGFEFYAALRPGKL